MVYSCACEVQCCSLNTHMTRVPISPSLDLTVVKHFSWRLKQDLNCFLLSTRSGWFDVVIFGTHVGNCVVNVYTNFNPNQIINTFFIAQNPIFGGKRLLKSKLLENDHSGQIRGQKELFQCSFYVVKRNLLGTTVVATRRLCSKMYFYMLHL